MKRTILVESGGHLRLQDEQLIHTRKEGDESSVPLDDLGFVVLESQRCTITTFVLSRLADTKVAVITCGADQGPNGLFLPLAGNSVQTEIFRSQVETTIPRRKQCWQQVVKKKLLNQAAMLRFWNEPHEPLILWSKKIRSGDPDNYEARGAAYYWKHFLPSTLKFKCDREGESPNNLLNYGYAILRSAVARAVVSSGLHPSIGIHHRNRYNHFCLADDLMEPYRPFVDRIVRELHLSNEGGSLSREAKSTLLSVLTIDSAVEGEIRPVLNAISATTASLVDCFRGQSKMLLLPDIHAD